MDKFLIYRLLSGAAPQRCLANESEIKFLLDKFKGDIRIIRASTNQIAVGTADHVLWRDIQDVAPGDPFK